VEVGGVSLHHLQQDFCEVEVHQVSYRLEGGFT
jgi:hypothetical protein